MSWFFKLLDSAGINIAGVDSSGNVKATLPTTIGSGNQVRAFYDDDLRPKIYSRFGTVSVGPRSLFFFDPVDGVAINTNLWVTAVTTMTIAQSAGGFISLNSAALTTANAAAQITGIKQVQFINAYPVVIRFFLKVSVAAQTNATMEAGAFVASGTSAPTDGVFFRWNSSGEFRCVVNSAGVETQSAAQTMPGTNTTLQMHIVVKGTSVDFYLANALLTTVSIPAGTSGPTSSSRYAPCFRVYNGASPPVTAPEMHVAFCNVFVADLNHNKPWMHTLSGMGRSAYQSPITTFAQSANWTNSTNPTSATLSNTAAGYTTLGGLFQFAAVVGASTDFALFGFQVPAGYQLYVTRISISAVNTGAAVATTATIMRWGVGLNSSAVSLATAESPPTSWSPRRIALGQQAFLVGAAIGTQAIDIDRAFETALCVDSQRFFHIILAVPVGTATASQVISGTCQIEGYFE